MSTTVQEDARKPASEIAEITVDGRDAPCFISQVSGLKTGEAMREWVREQADLARAAGVTVMRASADPDIRPGCILFEGWKEQPEDLGEQRWDVAK